MLILTRRRLWRVVADELAPSSFVPGLSDGVVHAVEGQQVVVTAAVSGSVAVSRDGREFESVADGIPDPITALLILSEEPLELLVGTENPRLFRVSDGVCSAVQSFEQLECRPTWHTPWGGPAALRSFARGDGGWVYADIHVGSIMRSPDCGGTWEPVTPTLHEDVHQVAVAPALRSRVVANTAHAVYVSADRGTTWDDRGSGLGGRYGRALAMHPADPDSFLATVSDGPHGENVHGQLFLTRDAGRNWSPAGGEFPESTAQNIDTFHLAYSPDGRAWAAVGRALFLSEDGGSEWRRWWEAPEPIRMLSASA